VELKSNQSALILAADEAGETSPEVASSDMNGVTGSLREAMANRLMRMLNFRKS
jgi:hypothetical protein